MPRQNGTDLSYFSNEIIALLKFKRWITASKRNLLKIGITLISALFLLMPSDIFAYTMGKVVDFFTKKPLRGAIVVNTDSNHFEQTDENGLFSLKNNGNRVGVRAYGYLRAEQTISPPLKAPPQEISLFPFAPKALYLSFYGVGDRSLRESALKLIEETELNALVIDVKETGHDTPELNLASEVALKNNNRKRYEHPDGKL
jgi:hypothetical protein